MLRRLFFTLAGVSVLSLHAAASPGVDARAVLQRLSSEHGAAIASGQQPNLRYLEFCPDNTCTRFEAAVSVTSDRLSDFVVAYLFYASGYTYLRDFVGYAGPTATAALVPFSGSCPQTDPLAQAACGLTALASDLHVSVYSTRSDEGSVTRTCIDLHTELSARSLKAIQDWRSREWGNRK